MFHRSARLLLRPVFEEDWEEIYHGINDEGVVRMLANAPWPYQENDAREFTGRGFDPIHPRFLVTLPGSDGSKVVGCIGVDRTDEGFELGYWIARPFWGRGYATEAGRGVLAIQAMLGRARIVAGHAVDNPASARVLKKLGFHPTGEVRMQMCKGRGKEIAMARYVNEMTPALGVNSQTCIAKAA